MEVEKIKPKLHTVEDIQKAVLELLQEKGLRSDEIFVLLYSSNDRWVVWIYPQMPDLDKVEMLLTTSLMQVKQVKAVREKEIQDKVQDKLRKVYTC